MGLRFRKSVKLAPGVKMNLSKSGVSTTTKLGGGFSWRTQILGGRKGQRIPLPQRWWFILAALVFVAIVFDASAETATRIGGLVIGLLMLAVTVFSFIWTNKKSRPK